MITEYTYIYVCIYIYKNQNINLPCSYLAITRSNLPQAGTLIITNFYFHDDSVSILYLFLYVGAV
jgi:hypothetical protein